MRATILIKGYSDVHDDEVNKVGTEDEAGGAAHH